MSWPRKPVAHESEELQRAGGELAVALREAVQFALRARAEVQERHQHAAATHTYIIY